MAGEDFFMTPFPFGSKVLGDDRFSSMFFQSDILTLLNTFYRTEAIFRYRGKIKLEFIQYEFGVCEFSLFLLGMFYFFREIFGPFRNHFYNIDHLGEQRG